MGRSILADESIPQYIEQLISSGQWYIGLIIGQLTDQKDYVVRLVRTPDPVEDEVSEEEDGEVVHTKKRKKDAGRPKNIELADDQWVATHAKQVTRMLPGGLDVVGVFALAPPTMMQNAQAKLRQILFEIHRSLHKNIVTEKEDAITDLILLQICSASRKLTCRTFDVADNRSSARPADWRYQSVLDRWRRINSHIAVDLTITVPKQTRTHSMLKQMQQGIAPFCRSVWNGLVLVNGTVPDPMDPVDPSSDSKKRKDKAQVAAEPLDIDMLVQLTENDATEDPKVSSLKSVMVVKGQVVGRAFVNSRATMGEAGEAIKTDIVRSLLCRCELLCEDLEVVEGDGAKELYDTPVRVFGHLPNSSIDFCDYMFQDEKIEEVVDRIKELLDIEITETDLELQCERPAAEEDLTVTSPSPDDSEEIGTSSGESPTQTFRTYLGLVISGAVAALAGLSYMYFGDS